MSKKLWISLVLVFSLVFSFTQAAAYGPTVDKKPVNTLVPGQKNDKSNKGVKATQAPKDKSTKDKTAKERSTDHQAATAVVVETAVTAAADETAEPEATPAPENNKGKKDKTAKENHKPAGKPTNVKGAVTTVDGETVTMTLKDGSTVTLTLDETSTVKIPGVKGGAVPTLKPGEKLVVRTVTNTDGTTSIVQAKVIPAKPERVHHVGIVSEYVPGVSITITSKDGSTSTFTIAEATKLLGSNVEALAVGARITVIFPRNKTGETTVAAGIVVHPGTITDEEPAEPTVMPTGEVTGTVTVEPTAEITETPTAEVTLEPTAVVTEEPTAEVTEEPTAVVTEVVIDEPTATVEPTLVVTDEPTVEPTLTLTPTLEVMK